MERKSGDQIFFNVDVEIQTPSPLPAALFLKSAVIIQRGVDAVSEAGELQTIRRVEVP